MILYGSTMSPFVRKVAAYAAEKGLELEIQPTGFPNHSQEFCAASPFRKMPALVDEDYCLSDSSAIIHYLEAKYPDPELIPFEPRARGRVIWFDEFADTILFACGQKVFFNRVVAPRFLGRAGDEAVAEAALRDEWPPIPSARTRCWSCRACGLPPATRKARRSRCASFYRAPTPKADRPYSSSWRRS